MYMLIAIIMSKSLTIISGMLHTVLENQAKDQIRMTSLEREIELLRRGLAGQGAGVPIPSTPLPIPLGSMEEFDAFASSLEQPETLAALVSSDVSNVNK